MTKREMSVLRALSVSAAVLSALVACASVAVVRLSAISRPPYYTKSALLHVPLGFLIAEIVLCSIVLFVSMIAILCQLMPKSEQSDDGFRNQRRAVAYLLFSAFLFSVPFRSVAELVAENGVPNLFLVYCADALASLGTMLIFIYLWWYPFVCTQSEFSNDDPERRKLPIIQFIACLFYALVRTILAFALSIHFKPLPLQNGLALLSIVTHGAWSEVNIFDSIAIILVTLLEMAIISYILWSASSLLKDLSNSIDISSHQTMIAMRYFQQSAVLFLANVVFIALVSALESSPQLLHARNQTENLILSRPLGNSTVAIAVVSYALREFYVHHTWRTGTWLWMCYQLPFMTPINKNRYQHELVYRVSDERNPLTGFPTPQEHTFSLESATLLFNISWLVAMYTGDEESSPGPEDFGRPAYSVYSEVMGDDGTVAALILQSADRIMVAFKPVSVEIHRHSFLLPLSQTRFGISLCGGMTELDALQVKLIPSKEYRLFRKSKVHAGFEKVYSALREQILQGLSTLLQEQQRPIYITGYASGGAVATLCILDLNFRQFIAQSPLNCIYTFGSPKVMNPAMVRFFHNHVPYRWRCVVLGDSFSVQPISSSFTHMSKVATFTRNGHLTIDFRRKFKWWQSQVSVHPMHKLSAYYCALENWHAAFHIKRPIDLWDWPVSATVKALFRQQTFLSDSRWPLDSALDSPTPDIESRSVRKLDAYFAAASDAKNDDVVAFTR